LPAVKARQGFTRLSSVHGGRIKVTDVTQVDDSAPPEVGHTHSDLSGGWLRPAVFGAMDGLVTNISLVAGVGGGGASPHVIVLTGMAGLVAGAFSMALGEYASVQTQNDSVKAEVATELRELRENPVAEQAELEQMFADMGLTKGTARRVAEEIHQDEDLAVRVHIEQELGVNPDDQPSPVVAAISSFLCFSVGALFPLLPFLFGLPSLLVGLAVGGVGLFVAGAIVSRFTTRSWWFNGLRQLAFGVIAAGATYLVGLLIGVSAAG
jgi:vacuolar iron transporter family protein